MPDVDYILAEVRKIADSGALGRSRTYLRLLEYLAARSSEGTTAKEVDIAADVFEKGGEFDSNQDSAVRVYVHNLRQKLDNYYETPGEGQTKRLRIPRGEYRLTLEALESAERGAGSSQNSTRNMWLGAITALLIANLIAVGISINESSIGSQYTEIAESSVWSGVLSDDSPLLVVVGDYFIFAELDTNGNITRMVREFHVNSSADLGDLMSFDPSRPNDYLDLDLTYLPQGTAFALKDLLKIVYTSNKTVNVIPASELRIADLKSNDILYVGYISALGVLQDFVFSASSLRIGETYDELLHKRQGTYYRSSAGIPDQNNYRDFGLVSTFPGPVDNQILIVAGTRDAGLMHTAQMLASGKDIEILESALAPMHQSNHPSFEALFEVTGLDRINLNARMVHTSPLAAENIWNSDLSSVGRIEAFTQNLAALSSN